MTKAKFGGRPIGAKNKISEAMRESLADVLKGEIEGLKERFESLYNIQRIELMIKLLPYIVPKLATEININEQSNPDRFDFDDYEVKVLDGDGSIINTHTYKKIKNE
jgi:hypothetical protein